MPIAPLKRRSHTPRAYRRRIASVLATVAALLAWHAGEARSDQPQHRWAIGIYGGALTENSFINSLYSTDPKLASSYLAAVDVSYVLHRFQVVPVDLEIDVTIARRFGRDDQWDFGVIPMLRWKELPWNRWVYTNVRLGLLGASYVTGISPWELHWAGNDHGSHFLNYLSVELDFRKDAASPLEFFIRSHHRSGIFGTINDTYGGSTYITSGLRWHF